MAMPLPETVVPKRGRIKSARSGRNRGILFGGCTMLWGSEVNLYKSWKFCGTKNLFEPRWSCVLEYERMDCCDLVIGQWNKPPTNISYSWHYHMMNKGQKTSNNKVKLVVFFIAAFPNFIFHHVVKFFQGSVILLLVGIVRKGCWPRLQSRLNFWQIIENFLKPWLLVLISGNQRVY